MVYLYRCPAYQSGRGSVKNSPMFSLTATITAQTKYIVSLYEFKRLCSIIIIIIRKTFIQAYKQKDKTKNQTSCFPNRPDHKLCSSK